MDIQHLEVSSELCSTMHGFTIFLQHNCETYTSRKRKLYTKHAHFASQLSTFDCRLDANVHSKCPWCGGLICELTAENMWARYSQSHWTLPQQQPTLTLPRCWRLLYIPILWFYVNVTTQVVWCWSTSYGLRGILVLLTAVFHAMVQHCMQKNVGRFYVSSRDRKRVGGGRVLRPPAKALHL